MRLLELFSGTKSVSKAVEGMFDEVYSVDILQKFAPTEVANILEWNYKKFPPGYFDAIWASPPCTEYSKLNSSNPQKIPNVPLANSIVQRTIKIIEYYKPELYFIENPQTGTLRHQEFMDCIPYYDVDYCRYSDWGYRKRTRIWTNREGFEPLLCLGRNKCPNMLPDREAHIMSTGNNRYGKRKSPTSEMMYRIPDKLIQALFAK
jgi:site-specific DNA-cytosine methylase